MITGCFSDAASCSATDRVVRSAMPPAPNGRPMRSGFEGKALALPACLT
jgi:hypothetical protein